jgi:YVTN family beta-propeller protein
MKQSNRSAARCGPAHYAPESGVRRPPSRWRAATLVALLLGTFSLSTPARRVEAGTIPTGATPTDTAIRTDGLVSYVLNSGNSTLSVVNVSNSVVLSTIPLLQPPNACLDIDWSSATSRVLVGCTNGNVLSVDPTTGVVAVAGANGACCFDVICADSLTPGVTGWAIDRNTSRLYMICFPDRNICRVNA